MSFDAHRRRPGKYTGEITLDSSAGERIVPFSARVRGPSWLRPFATVSIYGFGGMVAGGTLRTLPFSQLAHSSAAHPGFGWLSSASGGTWQTSLAFAATVGAILFVWTTLEAIARRSCALWLSMGFFGTLAILAAAIFGADLLRAGDKVLEPIFRTALDDYAAGAWTISGAGLGAIIGTLRCGRDLFSARVLAVLGGWIAVVALLYSALRGLMTTL